MLKTLVEIAKDRIERYGEVPDLRLQNTLQTASGRATVLAVLDALAYYTLLLERINEENATKNYRLAVELFAESLRETVHMLNASNN